jgi:cytochrome c-type biogenesis protein CcmH
MLLWVGFAILTAAVVALLLRPLLAPPLRDAAPDEADAGAVGAVYRDQLVEIEAEHQRGIIAAAEAEAARVEIARRLLAAADGSKKASGPAVGAPTMVAMLVAVALPLAAIMAYLTVGAPGSPGVPHASRGTPAGTETGVGQLVAKVEERLREHPEDGRGWDVIAPVYLRLGRYHDSANAFARASRLLGESPDRLAGLAESLILANDGLVSETARKTYERLRELAPDRVEPHFWLAVAAEQDGRLQEAASAYEKMLAESDPDAGWRQTVAERWRTVRGKIGLATVAPLPRKTATAAAPGAGKAPARSKEDVEAVQSMTPDARRQMIEDMVAGLDKRLSENGGDLEGWQRLIRAYTVLGRRDDALAALERARKAMAEQAASLETLATLARSLGLSS